MESVVTCPPGDKSPLARSVMQLLISGDHADMRFILNKTDLTHCSTCEGFQGIRNQNTLEIPAHRVIVATRCDWFRRALLSGMKESIERCKSLGGIYTVVCLFVCHETSQGHPARTLSQKYLKLCLLHNQNRFMLFLKGYLMLANTVWSVRGFQLQI